MASLVDCPSTQLTTPGPKVIHEAPVGSVTAKKSANLTPPPPLFNFSSISEFVIPRREFCGRLFAVVSDNHRIIGYPMCITDNVKYDRNDFIFNFCLVLDEDAPWSAYTSIVKKMARLFRNLEEQTSFLSRQSALTSDYDTGTDLGAICEMIIEDLNSYSECMIPIGHADDDPDHIGSTSDNANILNLKLFPARTQPPVIQAWHVPLSLVNFLSMQTARWDLTVQRVLPFIDGTNSISIIATLADTDLDLTKKAIAHLVYYGCVLLLDIFSFSACYAPTPEISDFITDDGMQDECRRYIASPISMFGKSAAAIKSLSANLSASAARPRLPPTTEAVETPTRAQVLDLYTSLRQGQALRDWCLGRTTELVNIDVRRFVTFGVIKGFLYRVHKYAVAAKGTADKPRRRGSEDVARYLDGMHCLDEICTEWKVVDREAVQRLKRAGDVVIVNK